MPEIAEVEIIRRGLHGAVTGLPLTEVTVLDTEKLVLPGRQLTGVVSAVLRHGKRLGLHLDAPDGPVLTAHLRMTGTLIVHRSADAARRHPHTRAVLSFGDTAHVSFVDVRRFGTLTVKPRHLFASGLGVDLLTASRGQLRDAAAECARLRRPVKAVMLDQRGPVAGAGNYLCDETLYRHGTHPGTPAGQLSAGQWERLWRICRDVAERMLDAGGVSLRDFRHADGSPGRGQQLLACYGHAGRRCARCASTFTKATVAGRGSTFCPGCQPKAR